MGLKKLRLGTRGSQLALAQTQMVADAFTTPCELVTLVTSGDRNELIGDKSRWIDTLENELLAGNIELAVHSAKDVPGELADGCILIGAPCERGNPYDALVGAPSLADLREGAVVGTSALRRRSQLLSVRPDLDVRPVRGNVDTRLGKLKDGTYDALVIAAAGIERIGRSDEIGCLLTGETFIPAAGQGVLVVEARAGDAEVCGLVEAVNNAPVWTCVVAERALVVTLGATCHTPVGAYAELDDENGMLTVAGFVGLPDGTAWLRDRVTTTADDPASLGRQVAERMLASGAGELLAQADKQAQLIASR